MAPPTAAADHGPFNPTEGRLNRLMKFVGCYPHHCDGGAARMLRACDVLHFSSHYPAGDRLQAGLAADGGNAAVQDRLRGSAFLRAERTGADHRSEENALNQSGRHTVYSRYINYRL